MHKQSAKGHVHACMCWMNDCKKTMQVHRRRKSIATVEKVKDAEQSNSKIWQHQCQCGGKPVQCNALNCLWQTSTSWAERMLLALSLQQALSKMQWPTMAKKDLLFCSMSFLTRAVLGDHCHNRHSTLTLRRIIVHSSTWEEWIKRFWLNLSHILH